MTKRSPPPKLSHPFRRPLPFQARLIWASSLPLRIVASVLLTFAAIAISAFLLQRLGDLFSGTAVFLSQPGLSTLLGAVLGASVGLVVSYTLQRAHFRAKSLLDKKESLYGPLLESLISFIDQLETQPYPWQIAHIGREPNFSLQPQAGFLSWSDIVSSGRVVYVPDWLRSCFQRLDSNIAQYNMRVRRCSKEVEMLLATELIRRGLIEKASGFSEIHTILVGEYDARVVTPFSQIVHAAASPDNIESITAILPALFRQYGQLPSVELIRDHYQLDIVRPALWLGDTLQDVIRLIELSYGSRDSYL